MIFAYADKQAAISDPKTISCIQEHSNVTKQIAKEWLSFAINKNGDYGSSDGNCIVATSYLDNWAKNGIVHVSEAKEWLKYGFSPTSGFIRGIRENGYTPRNAKYYIDKGFSKYDLGTKYSYAQMQRKNSYVNDTNRCKLLYNVTATLLNVRDMPSINGKVVAILHKSDQVCVDQEDENWAKINNGWISKKYLTLGKIRNQNIVQPVSTSSNQSSGDDAKTGIIIFGLLIVLAFIFFGLKTLFYNVLISLGMAEPDGRTKNGIHLTRFGKFMRSISGLIIFFLIMLIGLISK